MRGAENAKSAVFAPATGRFGRQGLHPARRLPYAGGMATARQTDSSVIDLDDVSLHRGGKQILRGVCWRVRPGEHWALLGANGSGKTTLLRVATGYLWPSRGRVAVLGQQFGRIDLRVLRRRIGWASSALGEMISRAQSARQIVLSGAFASTALWDPPSGRQRRRAERLMAMLDIARLGEQPYGTLSLGEQQRALIARALMPEPDLLILDEPCAGLDLPGREVLLRTIDALAVEHRNMTLVMVSHHIEEILPRFTHALVLRDGRVLAAGAKAEVFTPEVLSRAFDLPVQLDLRDGRYWPRVTGHHKA